MLDDVPSRKSRQVKTRIGELFIAHWAVFCALIPLTSYLIARDPYNTLPYIMMAILLTGFVKIVGNLTEMR